MEERENSDKTIRPGDSRYPDMYARVSVEDRETARKFHASSSLVHLHKPASGSSTTLDDELIESVELSECKFSIIAPTVELLPDAAEHSEEAYAHRSKSVRRFGSSVIPRNTVHGLIHEALCTYPSSFRRGYPSSGALYPVETILVFREGYRASKGESLVFHLLPNSKTLEEIRVQRVTDPFYELTSASPYINDASIVLVYIINIDKAIFKYGLRGYRHAMMEVGSMYQNVITSADRRGLANCLCSQFDDYKTLKLLGLDPQLFAPALMHFVGTPNS